MPRQKKLAEITNADTLLELKERLIARNFESPLLDLRLNYNELCQIRDQYLETMAAVDRVYPNLLPTQASGRWSVSNPPLVNFPAWIRDTYWPDEGQAWVGWDFDAIEAKIVAAKTHDKDDLAAFNNRWDIHTLTACGMMGFPEPSNKMDPHQAEEDEQWRQQLKWEGKDDPRRIIAKVRYALLYGKDWTAIHASKYERDFVKKGFSRQAIADASKAFLRSKPLLVSKRKERWSAVARAREARTIFGRRRRLFGDWWSRAKEGWNHEVQGSVTDMVNRALIEILTGRPQWHLVFPSHDAAKISVPLMDVSDQHYTERIITPTFDNPLGFQTKRNETIAIMKAAAEKVYNIDGESITSTGTWHIFYPDGSVEDEDSTTGKWKRKQT